MKGDLRFGTDISYGWNILEELSEILPEGDAVLILGRGSAKTLDLEERISEKVSGRIDVFSGVEPNPLDTTIMNGADLIRTKDPRYIIAAGGGSVMDAAKFMAVIARHGGNVMDYISKTKIPPDSGYPVYAIPTTPGTSSEITPFSVVTVPELNNKLGLRHPSIYPEKAIIDPSLTISLPKDQTAATGFDILSHSVESFWARNATPLTKQFSLNAVRLVKEHLVGAYEDGSSREHREGLSMASIFAGLAFSNTGTTICHSISYPITFDTDLSHGMACALSLGPTFDILVEKEVHGMSDLARAFGSSVSEFKEDLKELMRATGAPTSLEEIGFKGGAERIMSTDMRGFQANFTVRIRKDDVKRIIENI
jgi:alcohol dehydrogenase